MSQKKRWIRQWREKGCDESRAEETREREDKNAMVEMRRERKQEKKQDGDGMEWEGGRKGGRDGGEGEKEKKTGTGEERK